MLLDTLSTKAFTARRLAESGMLAIVLLTSGTTGAPKGANRKEPQTLDPAAALLSGIPLRARGRTLISAPLFHAWGLAHLALALALSSTLVLRRRFEPADTLRAIDEHGVTALVVAR